VEGARRHSGSHCRCPGTVKVGCDVRRANVEPRRCFIGPCMAARAVAVEAPMGMWLLESVVIGHWRRWLPQWVRGSLGSRYTMVRTSHRIEGVVAAFVWIDAQAAMGDM